MYLIIGDKRRDLDLGFIMEIHNILELLANPHPEFHPKFLDHVDHFYILSELLRFISWHICIEYMVRPWVAVTWARSMLQNKKQPPLFLVLKYIVKLNCVSGMSATCWPSVLCTVSWPHQIWKRKHSCVPSWTSNCMVISLKDLACTVNRFVMFLDWNAVINNEWVVPCVGQIYLYKHKESCLFLITS